MERTRFFRRPVVWIFLVIGGAIALSLLFTGGSSYKKVDTSVMLQQLNSGNVKSVLLEDKEQTVSLDLKSPLNGANMIQAQVPADSMDEIFDDAKKLVNDGKINTLDTKVTKESVFVGLLVNLLPIGVLVLLLLLFMSQMQGGGSRVLNFGKSKAKLISKDTPKTTFSDVAGADEAVEELHEIKDFLQSPGKYQALGAKIPKGVLLYGPPGTGKTLLARAVAGEAAVPFFSISGADFVEMFVGVGAARVRDLFAQAVQHAPSIIFIDELDALGKARGMNLLASHDEREQTLNQLLAEMDGFDSNQGVIIMAATNRPEILDAALLRPGRFDRQVLVDRPDVKGRERILRLHAKKIKLSPAVDLAQIAAKTPGFVGADLANIINEAALLAARQGKDAVETTDFDEAIERVIAGLQKKSRVMHPHEKKTVAYHEAGHALVAELVPGTDPVNKISIIPRGVAALGYTQQLPTEDRYLMTRSELLARIYVLLGGRVAEEMIFGDISTGAQNDLQKATEIARTMVTQFGMSERLGLVALEGPRTAPFLPVPTLAQKEYSDETA